MKLYKMNLVEARKLVKKLGFYIRKDPELMGDFQLLSKATKEEFFIGEDLKDLVSTAKASTILSDRK
tara:strand:+ start:515 stop:715 length:201 start_codon:yes stop_codon:yes gene_type:complete